MDEKLIDTIHLRSRSTESQPIINSIKDAFDNDDLEKLVDILNSSSQPYIDIRLYFVDNLKDPFDQSKKFTKAYNTLQEICKIGLKSSNHTNALNTILFELSIFSQVSEDIRLNLNHFRFTSHDFTEVAWKFYNLLSNKLRIIQSDYINRMQKENLEYFAPLHFLIPENPIDSSTSASDLSEIRIENTELNLRATFRHSTMVNAELFDMSIEDFESANIQANMWQYYKKLFYQYKMGLIYLKDVDDGFIFQYFNQYLHIFREIGRFRFHLQKQSVYIQLLNHDKRLKKILASFYELISTQEEVLQLNRLKNHPLKELIHINISHDSGIILINEFGYNPLFDSFKVKSQVGVIKFKDYHQYLYLLRIICIIYSTHSKKDPFYIRRNELINLMGFVYNMDSTTSELLIELSIFNPKNRELEIWDMPIIQYGDFLIISPDIILSIDSMRVLENMSSQFDNKLFDKRGHVFEQQIIDLLNKNNIPAASGEVFSENGNIEIDALALWDSKIILFEAKCTKNVVEENDYINYLDAVAYSKKQLLKRRRYLIENWEAIKEKFKFLNMEAIPEIICVSLTNSPSYYESDENNFFVIDWMAFSRFFQSHLFESSIIGEEKEVLDSVKFRDPNKLICDEFIKYVSNLPQVSLLLSRVKLAKQHLISYPFGEVYCEICSINYSQIDLSKEFDTE